MTAGASWTRFGCKWKCFLHPASRTSDHANQTIYRINGSGGNGATLHRCRSPGYAGQAGGLIAH